MPIEIRELQINVQVNNPSGGRSEATAPAASSEETDAGNIVSECVEQVMNMLKDKEER